MLPGRRRSDGHPFLSTAAMFAGSALTTAVLAGCRPTLTGSPSAWSSEDVASSTTWLIAIVCAAWLALTTCGCLCALARGEHAVALRIAAFAPPLARRVLQATLVSTVVLLPTAAYATAPPAPLILHVGAGGRLTAGTHSTPATEIPVVRAAPPPAPASAAATATSTTATSNPTRTTAPAPVAAVPVPSRATRPVAHVPMPPARGSPDRAYMVRAGDNLWRIADEQVRRATGTIPSDDVIARYWQRLIAANRTTLRSGNPSLIFPGEVIALPLD